MGSSGDPASYDGAESINQEYIPLRGIRTHHIYYLRTWRPRGRECERWRLDSRRLSWFYGLPKDVFGFLIFFSG